MSSNIERPSLGADFSMDALAGVIERKMSGGYEVSAFNVIIARTWVFLKGAILGRAKSDRINTLVKLVAREGLEEEMCTFLKSETEKLLNEYGKEPSSFQDFFQETTFPGIDMGDINNLKALNKKKYRLVEILPALESDAALGIGFGAYHPELVRKMWVQSYETDRDADMWAEARRHGLEIPEIQSHVPLAEMEERVLLEVAEFVRENHPSLINQLGLN